MNQRAYKRTVVCDPVRHLRRRTAKAEAYLRRVVDAVIDSMRSEIIVVARRYLA